MNSALLREFMMDRRVKLFHDDYTILGGFADYMLSPEPMYDTGIRWVMIGLSQGSSILVEMQISTLGLKRWVS